MGSIDWLQNWYKAQCDQEWEHEYGVSIETLDNPGWLVTIDLIGTSVEGAELADERIHRDEQNWIQVRIENCKYVGAGGPLNLEELILVFRRFVEKQA